MPFGGGVFYVDFLAKKAEWEGKLIVVVPDSVPSQRAKMVREERVVDKN